MVERFSPLTLGALRTKAVYVFGLRTFYEFVRILSLASHLGALSVRQIYDLRVENQEFDGLLVGAPVNREVGQPIFGLFVVIVNCLLGLSDSFLSRLYHLLL